MMPSSQIGLVGTGAAADAGASPPSPDATVAVTLPVGPGRGFLFCPAKMGQDPVDDVLALNTSDDPNRSAAAAACFNQMPAQIE